MSGPRGLPPSILIWYQANDGNLAASQAIRLCEPDSMVRHKLLRWNKRFAVSGPYSFLEQQRTPCSFPVLSGNRRGIAPVNTPRSQSSPPTIRSENA